MFLFIVQKTGNPESFKPNSTQNENTVKNLDSLVLSEDLRTAPAYLNQKQKLQRTTPEEDFQNFQEQEQVGNWISSLASAISNPNPYLNGASKFQLWMDMFKNPGNYIGMPPYFQSIPQDQDFKRLVLGIMASPFSNQNMTDGEKRYTMNQAVSWMTRYVVNCANGVPQVSDTNNDHYGDLGDLMNTVSQASYSHIQS